MIRIAPWILVMACDGGPSVAPPPFDDFVAERGAWSTGTLGGTNVHVYTPSNAGMIGEGRGLLVALHGCAMNHTEMRDYGSWIEAAETWGVVVALPDVPGGGVYARCWSYYGANHSRTSGAPRALLQIVDGLRARPELAIDADQVYITGLSSGGGMAAVMGCLAPDVFAGVGVAAGPAIGTGAGDIGRVATTAASAQAACERLAGASASAFGTQMASAISGTNDYTVAQGYADVHADMFRSLYVARSGAMAASPVVVADLPGVNPQGTGSVWATASGVERVERLSITGMGHAWPAGHGGTIGSGFIDPARLDYAARLAEWFTVNNRRVSVAWDGTDVPPDDDPVDPPDDDPVDPVDPPADAPPTLTILAATAQGACLRVVGTARDDRGTPTVTVAVTGAPAVATVAADGSFTFAACGLATACHIATVVARDSAGQSVTARSASVGVGSGYVEQVSSTLMGHTSRFKMHPAGYGAADMTYTSLIQRFGSTAPFPLFKAANGDWYVDPNRAGGAGPSCG